MSSSALAWRHALCQMTSFFFDIERNGKMNKSIWLESEFFDAEGSIIAIDAIFFHFYCDASKGQQFISIQIFVIKVSEKHEKNEHF